MTPERSHWRLSGVFIVKFKTDFKYCSGVSNVDFEQVFSGWLSHPFTKEVSNYNNWKEKLKSELFFKFIEFHVGKQFCQWKGKHSQNYSIRLKEGKTKIF